MVDELRRRWDDFIRNGYNGVPAWCIAVAIGSSSVLMLLIIIALGSAIASERSRPIVVETAGVNHPNQTEPSRRAPSVDRVGDASILNPSEPPSQETIAARAIESRSIAYEQAQSEQRHQIWNELNSTVQLRRNEGYFTHVVGPSDGIATVYITEKFLSMDSVDQHNLALGIYAVHFIAPDDFDDPNWSGTLRIVLVSTRDEVGRISPLEGPLEMYR